jgi:hypothetical protein
MPLARYEVSLCGILQATAGTELCDAGTGTWLLQDLYCAVGRSHTVMQLVFQDFVLMHPCRFRVVLCMPIPQPNFSPTSVLS